MNFLAHFFLSSDSPSLMVGNFLGDFVKGRKYQQFPESIARGILLHREIDNYTDSHPVFLESKHRLVPQYGHYAGVVVDMFYDHLLAVNWKQYGRQDLEAFAAHVYRQLQAHQGIFPEKAAFVLPHMIRYDWLVSYAHVDGIRQALKGIARRTRFASGMEGATANLIQHFSEFDQEFQEFFPEIIRHISLFLKTEE